MADAQLLQRPADLGQLGLGDLPAGRGRVEVVAAAIGVELDEQAMPLDHLGQAAKRRRRALLLDQDGRVDRRGRVVERDHQVERRLPDQPGMASSRPGAASCRPSAGAAASGGAHPAWAPPRPRRSSAATAGSSCSPACSRAGAAACRGNAGSRSRRSARGRAAASAAARPPPPAAATACPPAGRPAPRHPSSAWRPRQRRNVRSLTPSAAAASTWLSVPASQRPSKSSKRITPILERIPARPSRPSLLERF